MFAKKSLRSHRSPVLPVMWHRRMTNTSNMLHVYFTHSLSLSKHQWYFFIFHHRCLHFIHFFRYSALYSDRCVLFFLPYDAVFASVYSRKKWNPCIMRWRHESVNCNSRRLVENEKKGDEKAFSFSHINGASLCFVSVFSRRKIEKFQGQSNLLEANKI